MPTLFYDRRSQLSLADTKEILFYSLVFKGLTIGGAGISLALMRYFPQQKKLFMGLAAVLLGASFLSDKLTSETSDRYERTGFHIKYK